MTRAVVVALVMVVAGFGSLFAGREVERAGACSGPGPEVLLLGAPVIIEGRVIEVSPVEASDGVFTTHTLTFEVVRGYRGAAAGERVQARGRIPLPGVPVMCAQFPADLVGRYAVIGLAESEDGAGLVAWATHMLYLGAGDPDPADERYRRAVDLAAMVTDSDPVAPLLSVDGDRVVCGEQATFRGVRFPVGQYVIHEYFGEIVAVVQAGQDGTFEAVGADGPGYGCGTAKGTQLNVPYGVWTVKREPGEPAQPGSLVEVAGPPLDPDVRVAAAGRSFRVSPERAQCGERVTIEGAGYRAGARLEVVFGGEAAGVAVTADDSGQFVLTREIPEVSCGGQFIVVRALRAEFAEFGQLAEVGSALVTQVDAAPGPPDVGDSPASAGRGPNAWVRAGLLVLAVAGLVAGWARRSRR